MVLAIGYLFPDSEVLTSLFKEMVKCKNAKCKMTINAKINANVFAFIN